MTTNDLDALRAFVEAGQYWLDEGVFGSSSPLRWQTRERFKTLLPAAWEALERMEIRLNALELAARYGTPFDPPGAKTGREMQSLRARLARLEEALEESVKLQSHYAQLLNTWDGGQRIVFETVDDWLARLAMGPKERDGGGGARAALGGTGE